MRKQHLGSKLTDKSIFVLLSSGILLFILYPYLNIFIQALKEPGEKFSTFFMQNLELTKHSVSVALSTMTLSLVLSVSVMLGFIFISKKWQKILRLFLPDNHGFATICHFISLHNSFWSPWIDYT
jgi:hypothetical protein